MFKSKKVIIPIVLIAVISIYCGVILSMGNKLPGGTVINRKNCSFMDSSTASEVLSEKIESRIITLKNNEEVIKDINVSDYATMSFSKETIETIINKTSVVEKLLFFIIKSEYELEPEVIVNDESINELVKEFGGTENPQNAYIKYDEINKEFIIVPEVNGNSIDTQAAKDIIKKAIQKNENEANISEAFIKAGVLSSDEKLNEKLNKLNDDFNFQLKFVVKDGVSTKTTILKGDELFSMYKTDEYGVPYTDDNGQYEVDTKQAQEYIESIIPKDWLAEETVNNKETDEGEHITPHKIDRNDVVKEQTDWLIRSLKEGNDSNSIIE